MKVIEKLRCADCCSDNKIQSLKISTGYEFKKTKLVGVSSYRMGPRGDLQVSNKEQQELKEQRGGRVTQQPASPGNGEDSNRGGGTMEMQLLLEEMLDEEKEGRCTLASSSPLPPTCHWCLHWPNPAGSQSTPEPGKGSLQVSPGPARQSRGQRQTDPGLAHSQQGCEDAEYVKCLALTYSALT